MRLNVHFYWFQLHTGRIQRIYVKRCIKFRLTFFIHSHFIERLDVSRRVKNIDENWVGGLKLIEDKIIRGNFPCVDLSFHLIAEQENIIFFCLANCHYFRNIYEVIPHIMIFSVRRRLAALLVNIESGCKWKYYKFNLMKCLKEKYEFWLFNLFQENLRSHCTMATWGWKLMRFYFLKLTHC